MQWRLIEEDVSVLEDYQRVAISFRVESVLEVCPVDHGLGGIVFTERRVESPYLKDYDAISGEGPTRWAKRWDISRWGVISAFLGDERIGGCVIAYDTEGVEKLEGRKDIAALWDLRVRPDYRRRGVGSQLFEAAVEWAARRGCRCLKVDTQNINVAACRFYAKHGGVLGVINRYAYSEFPDETELVWYRHIPNVGGSGMKSDDGS